LILDADEYIVQASRDEVNEFINSNKAVGRIRIINTFYQDGQTKESQSFISRLIPRGVFFKGRIHEQVISNLPRKNVPIDVYHDGYYKTDKSHRNLQLLGLAVAEQPNDNYLLYQIGKENRILKNYTKARGFFEKSYNSITLNDGFKPQLIVEYLYTIINLNDYEKGLAIIGEESDLLADFPDFHFVCGLFFMELVFSDTQKYINYFPMIEKSYLTCLELGDATKYDSVVGTGSFYAAYNLAVFYETTGDIKRALTYYEVCGRHNYKPAIERITILNQLKDKL
jgi:tetratricopeptide (TPR) repeat protein